MSRPVLDEVTDQTPPPWNPRALTGILVAQFAAFGVVLGIQGVIWIEVMTDLALREGVFGTLQLALPLVGFLILMFNGQLYATLGTKLQSITALVLLGAGMLVLALTGSVWTFTLALVLSGLGFAMLDAATNSAGMDLEKATGRHVLNVMHGVQSAGVMLGAVVCGFALSAGLSYHAVAALSILVFCVPVVLATLPVRFAPGLLEEEAVPEGALLRNPAFRRLAGVTFLGSAAEAVAVVWTVIYLTNLDASIALAGVTYAIFNGAMLVGRFVNSPIVVRFGPRISLLASSVGIVVAMIPLVFVDNLATAVVAFALLGFSVAGVQPTALSASAPISRNTGSVAAGIMMSAYAALLIAPVVYGWVADFTSLRHAMIVVAVCGFLAVWLSLGISRAKIAASTD